MMIHGEPAVATEAAKQAFARAGAVITSAQRLGNQALVFGFELDPQRAPALLHALEAAGALYAESTEKLRALIERATDRAELIGQLHVALVHHAPDQRVELPKVPG